jgi:hypothetical protein
LAPEGISCMTNCQRVTPAITTTPNVKYQWSVAKPGQPATPSGRHHTQGCCHEPEESTWHPALPGLWLTFTSIQVPFSWLQQAFPPMLLIVSLNLTGAASPQ